MRPLQVADAETIVLGLQDEIRRSEESRYDHRLHGVLLVAQGMTCPEVGLWDGKTLSAWIEQRFQVRLLVRQCQRLFRQRGFRLRKPRPMIAHADPERQRTHKKTSGVKRRPQD